MERAEILDRIARARLVVRVDSEEDARTAVEAGADVIELDTAAGTEAVPRLVRDQLPGLPGIGGITTPQQAWEAVEAGARFLTASSLTQEIASVAEAAGVPVAAVVESEEQLQQALALRPDLLRLPDRKGLLVPVHGPSVLYELAEPNQEAVAAAAAGGAVGVVVRWRAGLPSSGSELERLIEQAREVFESR